MTLDELRKRRTEIERIAASHAARNVPVFGSVARGDAGPRQRRRLVDFDPDRTVLDLSALIVDLQAVPGCEVDVKELTRDGRAADRIRRDARRSRYATDAGARCGPRRLTHRTHTDG